MKILPYLLVIFLTSVLFSCSNSEKEARIKKIDSLQKELNNIEKQLISIDTSKARINTRKILDDLNFVQTNYTDTMSKEDAIKFGNYGRHMKLYSNLLKSMEGAYKETEALHIQLGNLKQDAINNKIPEGKFDEYFLTEQRDIGKLKGLAEMNAKAYTEAFKKQELMESGVEEILMDIKQNLTDSV